MNTKETDPGVDIIVVYYRGRDCINFHILGTKRTVLDKKVFVGWRCLQEEVWLCIILCKVPSFEVPMEWNIGDLFRNNFQDPSGPYTTLNVHKIAKNYL